MKRNSTFTFIVIAVIIFAGVAVATTMLNKKDATKPATSTTNTTARSTASNSSSPAATANAITIKDYMFTPATLKVKVGTTVTWTNQDAVSHTVTADSNSTDAPNSMDVAKGQSYSFTFKKAGTYTYHCAPHPYMKGSVEVTE